MSIFTEIGAKTSLPCNRTPKIKSCRGIGCPWMELDRVLCFKGKNETLLYVYWFVKKEGKKTPKHWLSVY